MRKFIKSLLLLIILLSFVCSTTISAAAKKDLKELLPGTWLNLWDYGMMKYKDETGKVGIKAMFTPSFHAYMEDYQDETYIKFNENGTGTFFIRGMLKNEDGDYDVVVRVYNNNTKTNEYIFKDELTRRVDFNWEIKGNKIHFDKKLHGYPKDNINDYEIEYNEIPKKPGVGEDLNEFNLKDEIIIMNIGQFLRITNTDIINDFKNRYKL